MRFLFKMSFWAAIVILIMPTDQDNQAKIYRSAGNAVSEAQSFCDKRPAICERGEMLWGEFKLKAKFAGALASDVAMELIFSSSEDAGSANKPDRVAELSRYNRVPQPARPEAQNQTLTASDRDAAEWRYRQ